MRDELIEWMARYPSHPMWRDGSFAGAPAAALVTATVPNAVRQVIGDIDQNYLIQGSAGKGGWTHTPWVAILDPAETSSVEEGIYVVYLLSKGCDRLYLTLNQGCTRLKAQSGIPATRTELARRAALIRSRVQPRRLKSTRPDLNTSVWRADLYEHGSALCSVYPKSDMPSEDILRQDLEEALQLYKRVLDEGGWLADDQIISEAESEIGTTQLVQGKIFRRHRQIERNPSHAKIVKRLQGTKCKGCDQDPKDIYGPVAVELVEAHHLRALATLAEGEQVNFDPVLDFAVLCPNCHRVIHRLEDSGDLEALRALLK